MAHRHLRQERSFALAVWVIVINHKFDTAIIKGDACKFVLHSTVDT